MAVDAASVRSNYVTGLQDAAKLVLQLNAARDNLDLMYQGNGLSGTFVAAELEATSVHKHMAPADIGTFTANLNTLNTAMTTNILQNMAKAVGKPIS